MRWNIFVSNQDKNKAEFYKFFGTKDECINYITELLKQNDYDNQYELDIQDGYIDYYGLSNIGANLIVAAFNEK